MTWAWVAMVIVVVPLAPAPTNPLCYNNQAYRNTHEQECMIDQVSGGDTGSGGHGGGGDGGGILGGLLGSLSLGGLHL